MERLLFLVLTTFVALSFINKTRGETHLSDLIKSKTQNKIRRLTRSYQDPRYGTGQPYDRAQYDRPRCGRCRDDRDDDNDRFQDRYDDDRRGGHRPTYGNNNRYDRNKPDNNDNDQRYSIDRNNVNKNGTEDENNKDKNQYDGKDRQPSAGRWDRDRSRDENRQRYRPDRDPYERDRYERDRYDRPYYDEPYRERRPLYDRYDDGYAGAYDGYGYGGSRRPAYDDRYDRHGIYDDGYGGYGPGVGRGPHDSFRPWDETYRGQSGWDAGGRGYYFASGRPDAVPALGWTRQDYRPSYSESGWQNVGYAGGYRDPLEYRGSLGYDNTGYRQDLNAGYGQASGWRNVGERRPYRDQSGIPQLEYGNYNQPTRNQNHGQASRQPSAYDQDNRRLPYGQDRQQSAYGQDRRQQPAYGQDNRKQIAYGQDDRQQNAYGQDNRQQNAYGQDNRQPSLYGQGNRQPSAYGQSYGQPANPATSTGSTTTQNTNYLFEREDERVTSKTTDVAPNSST